MKRLLSLFLCSLMIIGCFVGCKKKAVPTVASSEQITRGTWVKLLADSFYLNSTTEKPYFSDIAKDNELFNAVQACVDLGIIEKEDKFNKDNAVTYKEIALNTVNAIGISTVQDYLKTDKKLSEKKLLKFATDKAIVKSASEKFATTTDAEVAVKTAVSLYVNKPFVEKEKIELNDDIIDLKEQKITVANDSFTYDKAEKLKVGDIIILPPTEEYVGGVARKVESISGNTVNTVTPKLEEVYEILQLSSVTVPKVSDIKAANDGVTFENYSEIELTSAKGKPQVTTLALNSNNNADVLLLGNKGASFNVNINVTKGKLSIDEGWNSLSGSFSEEDIKNNYPQFKFDKNGNMYTSKYNNGYEIKGKISISDLSLTNDVDFGLIQGLKKAETKVNFKASVNLSVKGKINEAIDIFTTSIPIGTTGLWVDAVFSLVFDSNGDVSVKCTLENTTTYTYEKGLKTANDTKLNNKAAIAGNLSAKVGPRAVLVALGIDLFDIQAMIGLASKAEVSAEQGTSEIPCVDVKVYAPTLSIAFAGDKNTLLNQLGFSATWKVYDIDGGWQKPLTTLTYHYEAKNGLVDKCTHPEKTVSDSTKPSQKPTTSNKDNTTSSKPQNNTNQTRYFVETKRYDDIPVYYKNQISIENIKGETIEFISYDDGYKPITGLYALALGNIGDSEYYKVRYNGTIAYVNKISIDLKGNIVTANSDGRTFKLGDIIYHGKYHDVVITASGDYLCTDGCNGRLRTRGLAGEVGPYNSKLDDFRSYADADYTDPVTGKVYPLCTKNIVYKGTYGTVYVLSNKTDTQNWPGQYEGFLVLRNDPYRKITSLDDIQEGCDEDWVKENFDRGIYWDYNVYIYEFEKAKQQADSLKLIHGAVHYISGFGAG